MKTPFMLIGFKTEKEAFGKNAIKLARICSDVSNETGVEIAVSPHIIDIRNVIENFDIPVFAQHFHPVLVGKHTGHTPPELLKKIGVTGVLINHAEKPLSMNEVEERIVSCKKHDLVSIVCASTTEMVGKIAKMNPNFISYEPPEFIGSKTTSVSMAKPDVLEKSIRIAMEINPKVNIVCGAGVHNRNDIEIGLKLGAKGFLISTAIVKSDNPYETLRDLCNGLKT